MKLLLLENQNIDFSCTTKPHRAGNTLSYFANDHVHVKLSPLLESNALEEDRRFCSNLERSIMTHHLAKSSALEGVSDIWNLKITLGAVRPSTYLDTLKSIRFEGNIFGLLHKQCLNLNPRLLIQVQTYIGSYSYCITETWQTLEVGIKEWMNDGYEPLVFEKISKTELPPHVSANVSSRPDWISCRLMIEIFLESDKPQTMEDCSNKRIKLDNEDNPSISALNRLILQDESTSDTIIVAASGAHVKCHKAFLVAQSNVLKEMLESQTPIKVENGESGEKPPITYYKQIDMNDMSEQSVKAFLAFLYCCDESGAEEHCNVALDLLEAGRKYCIESLVGSMKRQFLEKDETWYNADCSFQLYLLTHPTRKDNALDNQVQLKMAEILKKKGRGEMLC